MVGRFVLLHVYHDFEQIIDAMMGTIRRQTLFIRGSNQMANIYYYICRYDTQ